jgi:hypothetical protein
MTTVFGQSAAGGSSAFVTVHTGIGARGVIGMNSLTIFKAMRCAHIGAAASTRAVDEGAA